MINDKTKVTLGLVITVMTAFGSMVFAYANMASREFVDNKVEEVLMRSRDDRKELVDEIKMIRQSIEQLYRLQLKRGGE